MNKDYFYVQQFESLSDCTDYYYTELGKLERVPGLSKSQYKKLYKWLTKSMNESIRLLTMQQSHSNSVMKIIDNDNYKEFMAQKKSEKPAGLLTKLRQKLFPNKEKVETIELVEAISQAPKISESATADQSSNMSKNSKSGSNQSQTKINEQRHDSCDDEPMEF